MSDLSRRDTLGGIALGMAGAAAAAAPAPAAPSSVTLPPEAPVPAFAGKHAPRPLSFDAAKLVGLSEKLVRSHWENNYQGSVKALNTVEGRLAAAMADKDFPAVIYSGLKREELHRTGSIVLHELYFQQLGGDGTPGGPAMAAVAQAFGSFDAWQAEFRRTALALAGGSGWAILAWNRHTRSLHNYWAWDHTNGPIQGEPILVLDMYEHAYHMDYGSAAAKYVDAFFANLDWNVIGTRCEAAMA